MLSEHISGLARAAGGQPLLHRHAGAAAGGDVDDRIGRSLDVRQELHEDRRVRRRAAVLGIARVQVKDRGAGFGRADRLLGDLLRRHRQVGDMVGVWIEPVTAQVMMTLRAGRGMRPPSSALWRV